jgi:hypothetical protein
MAEQSERRMKPRFVMNQLIELSIDRETFVPSRGVDVSEEGVRCIAEGYLEPYSRVYVMFTIRYDEKEEIIRAQGIVTNCQEESKEDETYALGIKLIDMLDDEKAKILRYIETL